MKGYTVESGYMGYVNGDYMLFASEMDYEEYMELRDRARKLVPHGGQASVILC